MTSVIKSCENCNSDFSIIIGSGRFCSVKCSRSFATKHKRKEINEKVSKTLKGKSSHLLSQGLRFKSGFDPRRKVFTDYDRVKAVISSRKVLDDRISKTKFELLSKKVIKRLILSEQSDKCLCGIDSWNGTKLSLHLDHIDGDKNNNCRNNLRLLCPNCHSITPTYCRKKSVLKVGVEPTKT